MITQSRLKELCDYTDNGLLIWKVSRKNAKKGALLGANSFDLAGYRHACVEYTKYKISRLIFLWHHGFLPHQVDHIDGDPTNDKIENLRAASQSQNQANTKLIRKNNSSGYRGVSFSKSRNKWEAKIQVNGETIHIGRFDTAENAARMYDKSALKYFNEFANLNFKESK